MYQRTDVSDSRLTLIYTYLDVEKKGYVSVASIANAMGSDLTEKELEAMVADADSDKDGHLTKA